jgi:hypothetical protein
MPLSGTVSHEASIQCSLHWSSLQFGAYCQSYTSPNPKRTPKISNLNVHPKKYLIIFDVARYGNISTFLSSSDGIWSHKLSRVHDSSMPEHRTATKGAADLPVFLGDLRWIVSSQLPPSSWKDPAPAGITLDHTRMRKLLNPLNPPNQ